MKKFIVIIGAAGAVSCATQSATTPAPANPEPLAPASAAPASDLVGPPQVAWKDMTQEQKGRFMKMAVMPKMKEAFQAFDADLFGKFECATCHGKDAKANGFKMPAADLFVLPGSQAGFGALMEKKGKWMKFMAETVKPQMATLLGLPEFQPQKPEAGGFGCLGCHTTETAN